MNIVFPECQDRCLWDGRGMEEEEETKGGDGGGGGNGRRGRG